MILHNDPLLSIYFGDARSGMQRDFLMDECSQEELWKQDKLLEVKKLLQLQVLVFLKQLHSAAGVTVSDEALTEVTEHKQEGDFLITKRVLTGLGVYTADCLPIVFYDTYNRVVGICHAGWAGSVNKVAVRTLERMQKDYGTNLDHLRIFFGPSAKPCCYEVKPDFKKHLEGFAFQDKVIIERGDQLFFDLPQFNRLQLEEYGVKNESFQTNYNICTICNTSYCSSRRDRQNMERQLTVVTLK